MRSPSKLIFIICLLVTCFSTGTNSFGQEKKVVVCSTTQVADFTRNVVGDRWEVICVLAAGEDPHTYETGSDDAANVARADLCLDNGWNLEGHHWMRRLAENSGKPIQSCVERVRPLELQEEDSVVKDPHAWFNPANAAIYVDNIVKAVSQVDPDHADEYQARALLYKTQLVALDNWINRQLATLPANQRVLITHHDAFGYFCQRYRFKSISPFGWTTAELTDLGVTQRKAVIDQIRESAVKAIFVETTINEELLQGIARDSGVKIGGKLYSDAMGAEGSAGETYLGMMRENVLTMVQALK